MQRPTGLIGFKVIPGEEQALEFVDDVRITNIAFGENIKGNERTVVRVHHRHVSEFSDDEEDEDDDKEESDEDEDEEEEQTFVLCSLYPGKIEQVSVDLSFTITDDVRFSVTGKNEVEILGNLLQPSLVDDYDEDPDSDEIVDEFDDESINSDDIDDLPADYEDEDDEDDDEEDDDISIEEIEVDSDLDSEEFEEGRLQEIEEANNSKKAVNNKKRSAEADVDESSASITAPVTDAELAAAAKQAGLDPSNLSKNQRKKLNKRLKTGVDESVENEKVEVVAKDAKDGKVKAAAATKSTETKDGKTVSKSITLPSGVKIEDRKVGSGPQAKAGNRLGMRYVGRLQNGKQFDANTKGKPFSFRLGKGEVIGGWDEGLKGMQVGGERRLTIPPKMGYGARGAPPDIPGNSTLVFDVKLVEIK